MLREDRPIVNSKAKKAMSEEKFEETFGIDHVAENLEKYTVASDQEIFRERFDKDLPYRWRKMSLMKWLGRCLSPLFQRPGP